MRGANRNKQRRGAALVYITAAMTVFAGFASLAVDWGHVRYVKTQLQCAADAGARYGAQALLGNYSQAYSYAVTAAGYNSADGSQVVLNQSTDVQLGTWSNSTFTVLTGAAAANANAVRVYARRTAATSNPVSLTFANLIGMSRCDVTATAIATVTPGGYGLIGLRYINLSGNSTDSYWSSSGYASGGNYGSIASNGNITLGGNSYVRGNAHPGVGGTVNNPSQVSGSTTPLTSPLVYSNASPTSYALNNNDAAVPSTSMSGTAFKLNGNQSVTLPGGNYYFRGFSLGSNSTLAFTGPATIYVYGSFSMSGGATTYSNLPENLTIILGPDTSGNAPGSMSLSGSSALYAKIYAPQSDITLSGSGDIYGSIVGGSVSSTGTSGIHYDASLNGPGTITMVK